MSVSHGHSTISGWNIIMGVVWRRQENRKSHIDAASTGYGDAHQLMSMQGVGIAMQRMH